MRNCLRINLNTASQLGKNAVDIFFIPESGSAAAGRPSPSCEPQWLPGVPSSPPAVVAGTSQPESPSETPGPREKRGKEERGGEGERGKGERGRGGEGERGRGGEGERGRGGEGERGEGERGRGGEGRGGEGERGRGGEGRGERGRGEAICTSFIILSITVQGSDYILAIEGLPSVLLYWLQHKALMLSNPMCCSHYRELLHGATLPGFYLIQ